MLEKKGTLIYMTSKPRTIDNLGIDASIRYAKDQQLFEPKFIEESKIVSKKTEIPVSRPYTPSEFEQTFSSEQPRIWATFSPPSEAFLTDNSLFSFQLIPSLGSYEKFEDTQQLLNDALERRRETDPERSLKEKQQEEKEKQLIQDLLVCIEKMDKSLSLINARRNQYQRG